MKIAVVDGDKIWREKAVEVIRGYLEKEVSIHTFCSGVALLEENKQYEIVVLDIELQGKDGFQTAVEYNVSYPDSIIIMLTKHLEMSRKGYLAGAFRYVDKCNMYEEMAEALSAARKRLGRYHIVRINVVNLGNIPIVQKDIICIETRMRKVFVHTYDNVYECSDSLGNLEKVLSEKCFFRCHKSYIVNLDAIKKIENVVVHMADGNKAMVGIKKCATLKKKYIQRKYEYVNL